MLSSLTFLPSDFRLTSSCFSAVNTTTVEVKFVEAVEDLAALNFKIDGLEITNKVIKQTDAKTVVLTTAAQEGGKTYTVTANDNKIGTFSGVSAVVPTGINVTTKSLQGVVGKDVTVSATVTVPEGQSKAGVPVTFNIVNSSSNNTKVEAVAYTNAEGVASYTYTRYYGSTDEVTAYATHKSSVYSQGKVYWANAAQLTVKDITESTTLKNGDKKVYEINSANFKGGYVFVAFQDNLNVTPDKVENGVTVEGNLVQRLNADGAPVLSPIGANYPYRSTLGNEQVIAVKLDANGKANLVLTGANASATPVVYEGKLVGTNPSKATLSHYDATYSATAIQALASKVTFDKVVNYGLTLEAQGVRDAAVANAYGTGGRDYEITYTKEDGKAVAAGTTVYVAIPTVGLSTGTDFKLLNEDEDVVALHSSTATHNLYALTTDKDGKALFTVTARNKEDYVQPVAFLNDNRPATATFFDSGDTQVTADVTYFTDVVTYKSSLALVNEKNTKQTTFAATHDVAKFSYRLVDQNDKVRAADKNTQVTFGVSAGEGQIKVDGTTVHPHQTTQVTKTLSAGQSKVEIAVTAESPTAATVYATSSQAGFTFLPTDSLTATFTNTSTVNRTGYVTNVSRATSVVTIDGVPYSLAGATYLNNGVTVPTLNAFYDHLTVGKYVSVTKDANGNLVFNLVAAPTPGSGGLITKAEVTSPTTIKVTFSEAVSFGDASQFWFDLDKDGVVDSNETTLTSAGASALAHTFTVASGTITGDIGKLVYTPSLATADRLTKTTGSVVVSDTITLDDAYTTIAVANNGLDIGATTATAGTAGAVEKVEINVDGAVANTFANGKFEVLVTSALDSTITAIEVTTTSSDSAYTVAEKVATALNADPKVSEHFTATATLGTVTLTTKNVPTTLDGTLDIAFTDVTSGIDDTATATLTPGTVATANVANATVATKADVASATVKAAKVRVAQTSTALGNFDKTITVDIDADAASTAAKTATAIVNALNADTDFAARFTATVTGGSSDVITVTNKSKGVVTATVIEEAN